MGVNYSIGSLLSPFCFLNFGLGNFQFQWNQQSRFHNFNFEETILYNIIQIFGRLAKNFETWGPPPPPPQPLLILLTSTYYSNLPTMELFENGMEKNDQATFHLSHYGCIIKKWNKFLKNKIYLNLSVHQKIEISQIKSYFILF